MIEIYSKKDVFWHVFLDIFWLSFSPETVPEIVLNTTFLSAEIANECYCGESVSNQLWLNIDRLYPTDDWSWKSELIPITAT